MPGCSGDHQDDGDDSDDAVAIASSSRRQLPATELDMFDLVSSDVDGCVCEDGDDTDADEEEEASQGDDRSTQNVEA
jgi:hypothetical protein